MNGTQHDGWAYPTPGNFHHSLLSIKDQLQTRDLSAMKFLCRDIIKANQLESITDGFELFTALQEMNLLGPRKTGLLAEMLYHIDRVDLVGHLRCDAKTLETLHSGYDTHFTPYRILLFRLARQLPPQNVWQMKQLLSHKIPKGLLEQINDATSLLEQLEKMQMIREENLEMLIVLLTNIHREDLVTMVKQYEKLRVTGQLPSSIAIHEQRPKQRPNVPLEKLLGLPGQHGNHQERPIRGRPIHQPVNRRITQPDGPKKDYCYNMTAVPRGYFVIINNVTFESLSNREGSDIDKEKLCKTWRDLKFNVVTWDNLTGKQIDQALAHFSQVDHSKFNAFVCCIMSHGDKGVIHGTDDKTVNICDLVSKFTSSSCITLAGKPKLFFFQACRGTNTPRGLNIPSDEPGSDDISSQLTRAIPDPADILLGYATVYGNAAYRLPEEGSLYICALTKMLDQLSDKQPLQVIMSLVTGETVKSGGPSTDHQYQVPEPICYLTKALYFFQETANKMNL